MGKNAGIAADLVGIAVMSVFTYLQF